MFDAVLFDCDGVLVDSEPITNGVLREMLAEAGWVMTAPECMQRFVGKTVREERVAIEAQTGQALTQEWLDSFYQRRNRELESRLQIIAGADVAVAPQRCLVIEDTVTGVLAGTAAGATVWAYCPQPEQGDALRQAGASCLFDQMAELPRMLAMVG